MSHCNHGSCSGHEHSHHHGDEECSSCCGHHHEHESCCHSHHKKYSDNLLALADEAWMELLKDKIKADILSTSGKQLEQLAKIVSEANHARWKYKMQEMGNLEDFESKLCSQLHQEKHK